MVWINRGVACSFVCSLLITSACASLYDLDAGATFLLWVTAYAGTSLALVIAMEIAFLVQDARRYGLSALVRSIAAVPRNYRKQVPMGYFLVNIVVFMLLMSVFKNNIWLVLPLFGTWLFVSLFWRFAKTTLAANHRHMAQNLGGTRGSPRFRPGFVTPEEAAKAQEAAAVMREFKQFEDEVDARTRHLRPEPKKRGPQNYAELHCHAILGITAADSQKTIKEAYRCKARQYHPDTAPDGLGSNAKFDMIKQAYEYAMYLRSRKI